MCAEKTLAEGSNFQLAWPHFFVNSSKEDGCFSRRGETTAGAADMARETGSDFTSCPESSTSSDTDSFEVLEFLSSAAFFSASWIRLIVLSLVRAQFVNYALEVTMPSYFKLLFNLE